MTGPGRPSEVPDADRAEQEALVDPPGETGSGEGIPEADALEQRLTVRPGEAGSPVRPVGDREANEADVLEQHTEVPVDDDAFD